MEAPSGGVRGGVWEGKESEWWGYMGSGRKRKGSVGKVCIYSYRWLYAVLLCLFSSFFQFRNVCEDSIMSLKKP